MKHLFGILLIFALLACAKDDPALPCGNVSVDDAWIREAPPGAPVMAGYGEFSNDSDDTIELLTANSASFSRIEFHETRLANGQMKMEKLETLQIPPASKLTLAPSGKHMMLFNPKKSLKAGDKIQIGFACKESKSFTVDFEVRKFQINDAHGHHGHH